MSLSAVADDELHAALALAQWMRREWHHFVTLTTARSYSRQSLDKAFQSGFVRRVARVAQRKIGWWYVIEDSADFRPHVHALLWGTRALTAHQLRRAWPPGRCDIRAYDPSGRAAHYMVKSFRGGLEWNFSSILPPEVENRFQESG